jgi:hypothetical protein
VRRVVLLGAVASVVLTLFAGAAMAGGAGGVTGPSFYVDGTLYRTVGTPTELSGTGAPESSFDTIYEFFGAQPYNVATAAPGDRGYNGGRWQVIGLEFADYSAAVSQFDANESGDFDNAAEVQAALSGGAATSLGVVKSFVCPVIPLPHHYAALIRRRSARTVAPTCLPLTRPGHHYAPS